MKKLLSEKGHGLSHYGHSSKAVFLFTSGYPAVRHSISQVLFGRIHPCRSFTNCGTRQN